MSDVTNQDATSRNIPLPIQRDVRQRCGFGCVLCGKPLYEYHHLLGWANVKRHVVSEITLLCDGHHREATSGLLPEAAIQAADSDPHNLREGASPPHQLHFSGNQCEVLLGGNTFVANWEGVAGEMIPVMIDGEAIIGFRSENGNLLLSCNIYDEQNQLNLQIIDNQMVYTMAPWDIQFVGQTLTLREQKKQILLSITFEPPHRLVIEKARLLRNQIEVLIEPQYLLVCNNNILLSGSGFGNFRIGLRLGKPPEDAASAGIAFVDLNRDKVDREASRRWAKSVGFN